MISKSCGNVIYAMISDMVSSAVANAIVGDGLNVIEQDRSLKYIDLII